LLPSEPRNCAEASFGAEKRQQAAALQEPHLPGRLRAGTWRARHGALLSLVLLVLALAPRLPAQQAGGNEEFQRHMRAGEALQNQDKYDDAIKEFRAAVKLNPKNSMAHLWLARVLGRKTEKSSVLRQPFMVGDVRTEFEKAVQLDPSNVDARSDLLEFYLEAPGVFGGGIDKARQQAEAIARLDAAEGHGAWARIAEKEKRFDVAEREYRAALAAKPDSASYRRDLEKFLQKHGRQQAAK